MSDLSFGSVDVLSSASVDTTAAVSVSCAGIVSTVIRVCLNINAGTGGADTTSRKLLGPGGSILRYQLYKDAARTQVWGSTTWGLSGQPVMLDLSIGLSGSTSSSATLYGRVSGNQSTAPTGTYISNFSGSQASFAYATLTIFDCSTILGLPPLFAAASFAVSANVVSNCNVTAQNIDFGTRGITNSNVDTNGQVTLTCTPNTAYSVSLSNGNTGTSPGARKMVRGAEAVTYGLYQNSARSQLWGSTIGTNTLSGTGTGGAQNLPVYGRVPPQTTPHSGTYSDTVVVTVTY